MPFKPKRSCLFAGCPRLTHRRYCEAHQRQVGGAYEQARGSAARRGYGRPWRKLRRLVLNRDPICSVDGCDQPSKDVDHIIPVAQGGDDLFVGWIGAAMLGGAPLWRAHLFTTGERGCGKSWLADLYAAGVGAPHIRQRLWWMAVAEHDGHNPTYAGFKAHAAEGSLAQGKEHWQVVRSGDAGGMAISEGEQVGRTGQSRQDAGANSGLGKPARGGRGEERADNRGCDARGGTQGGAERSWHDGGLGFWSDFDLIPCADGKARRVEPGTFPLAHGVPARVRRLRAYGNAISPPLAAEFIRAVMDA